MSKNKNSGLRFRVLDNCFRNTGRRYSIDHLLEECNEALMKLDPDSSGIQMRQLRKDIAFMKSEQGWSIELEDIKSKNPYYRYSDTSFSINNMPLNELEVNQLQSAISILTQFKGLPQLEWMHELVPKLQQKAIESKTVETIIDFDNNQYLKGIEHIGPLYNHILYRQVLKMIYHEYSGYL
jgi:hypothetical protein